MSLFENIKAGLEDALAYERGDLSRARIVYPPPIDVKALRKTLLATEGVKQADNVTVTVKG